MGPPVIFLGLLVILPLGAVAFSAGWKMVGRSKYRVGQTPYCSECGYNLTGVASVLCPECGALRGEQTVVHGEEHTRAGRLLTGWILCFVGSTILLPCLVLLSLMLLAALVQR